MYNTKILLIAVLLLAACGGAAATPSASESQAEESQTTEETASEEPTAVSEPIEEPASSGGSIILATTTSTYDSGLLDAILPVFEEETGITIEVVAVGTGQALALGESGDADVLLVHARAREEEFMAAGHGTRREDVMYNDFIIVGPPDDPAGITGMDNAAEALAQIADSGATFVSRGDDSGTHTKELSIWEAAGIEPSGDWYQSIGQGMGATLTVTSEKQGYTLTDRATYLATKANLELDIFTQGDPLLLNIYHVMQVNPDKHANINADGGKAFVDFMVSPSTQEVIKNFGVDKYGQPLFFPDADKTEADLGSV